ncbi:MAG: cyclic nucleotide-binding domain-containing protein [Deltaproteobacteria bacterium]|nr:cyclic nucleotide-binding domain-containing protein [Deltaproteobacteria bacterium]
MENAREISATKIRQAITDFLTNFPFFASLNSKELDVVSNYISFYEVDAGTVLFNEGQEADCVYFIVEGELDVIKETVGGKKVGIDRVVIATLSKGSTIGEMSVIEDSPRSATVRAKATVILVTLSREGFRIILDQHPHIGIKILIGLAQALSRNLRKTSGRLADYTMNDAKDPMAFKEMKIGA